MRILTVHNYYQVTGGEEQVFHSESDLLEEKGHEVHRYIVDNAQIEHTPSLALARNTLWNQAIYRELRSLIHKHQIQIAHFHNIFPLVSPAAYYAAKAEGASVVQTCHNYRLICPNAMFLRNGQVCEDCLGKLVPLPGIQHKCYRDSRAASLGVAAMLSLHRLAQTWTHQVDAYIALTGFAQQKLTQGGLPAQKVVIKPNFVNIDPGEGDGQGGYALFVGRLSPEKGVDLLLSAWKQMGNKIPLKIVGDGPLANEVQEATQYIPGISWLGRQPMEAVFSLMKEAMFLVFPSRWYEGLPRTLIESFATGTPVIAANLGSMSSLITHGETGLHFLPGSVESLIDQVTWVLRHPEAMHHLRQNARAEFIRNYTAESSYQRLMEIYSKVKSY